MCVCVCVSVCVIFDSCGSFFVFIFLFVMMGMNYFLFGVLLCCCKFIQFLFVNNLIRLISVIKVM